MSLPAARIRLSIRCLAALACSTVHVYAHRPLTTGASCGADWGSSAKAVAVPDPTISWSFKHYLDCTNRAVWMAFSNPNPGFAFYVGVGVPTSSRNEQLRADALIIGPGLPSLTKEEEALLPAQIRADPAWSQRAAGVGGILKRAPSDQTTCAHLGSTMNRSSTVRNGRCDFYEPYGATHSWRILDADGNVLPGAKGAQYHVAVFLQQHTSGKIGIALGTWVENFRTPFPKISPACPRKLNDFSEQAGDQSGCLPVTSCASGQVVALTKECAVAGADVGPTCPTVEGTPSKQMMTCGGKDCQGAAKLWETVGMKMHQGMAIRFTGSPDIDFVRGMIPHHQGAVDMCDILRGPLWCSVKGNLTDGLEHFCNHVKQEQERELAGMNAWLDKRGLAATATACNMSGHTMSHMSGCGNTTSKSSKLFIEANRHMHTGMAVKLGCAHSVDFVRGMIPHHAGAVAMCDVLAQTLDTDDGYLAALCADITRAQRAEIAFMSRWLSERSLPISATCESCASPTQPDLPCEDMLPTSSFCHTLGGDLNCNCKAVVAKHACGTTVDIKGFGNLDVSAECGRTCGKCPAKRPPLFHMACKMAGTATKMPGTGMHMGDGSGHNGHTMNGGMNGGTTATTGHPHSSTHGNYGEAGEAGTAKMDKKAMAKELRAQIVKLKAGLVTMKTLLAAAKTKYGKDCTADATTAVCKALKTQNDAQEKGIVSQEASIKATEAAADKLELSASAKVVSSAAFVVAAAIATAVF